MRHHAFTLIELLVVISIVATLAGLLLPAVSLVKNAARDAQCASNMRQIGVGVLSYAGDWDDFLPYSTIANGADPAVYGVASPSWPNNAIVGSYLELSARLRTSGDSWSIKPSSGVLHCPTSTFLHQPSLPVYAWYIQYGLNIYLCPDPANIAVVGHIKQKVLGRIRRLSSMALLTDTSEPRWRAGLNATLVPPFGVNPAVTYQNPDVPSSFASAGNDKPWCWVQKRHGRGANILFCDGHVQNAVNITAEAAAANLWVANECVP